MNHDRRPRLPRAFFQGQQLPLPTQTLTEATTMPGKKLCDIVRGPAPPVTLKFRHIGDCGERLSTRLNHALDAALMTFGAAATRRVVVAWIHNSDQNF
jgi:hypothetical protein